MFLLNNKLQILVLLIPVYRNIKSTIVTYQALHKIKEVKLYCHLWALVWYIFGSLFHTRQFLMSNEVLVFVIKSNWNKNERKKSKRKKKYQDKVTIFRLAHIVYLRSRKQTDKNLILKYIIVFLFTNGIRCVHWSRP